MSMNNFYVHLKNPNIQFVDEITDDLKCKKCKYIMAVAHTVPCGCSYCLDCIKIIINCNNSVCIIDGDDCKENILRLSQNVFPSFPAIKKIECLRVICINNGCEEIVQLKKIDDHLNICRFTTNSMNDHLYHQINDLKCKLNEEIKLKVEEKTRLKKELEDEIKKKDEEQTKLKNELDEERKKKKEIEKLLEEEKKKNENKKQIESQSESVSASAYDVTGLKKELEDERKKKEEEQTRLKKELDEKRKKKAEIKKLLEEEKKKNENKLESVAASAYDDKYGFIWTIQNAKEKMEQAKNDLRGCRWIWSDKETINKYCIKLILIINYKEDSIYLRFVIIDGNYDNIIPWPCCLDFYVEIEGLGKVGEFKYESGRNYGRDRKMRDSLRSEEIKLCDFKTLNELIKNKNLNDIKIRFYCKI